MEINVYNNNTNIYNDDINNIDNEYKGEYCFIDGDDLEILSEKIIQLGGVLNETKTGYLLDKNKYIDALYLSFTGELPIHPKEKIKIKLKIFNMKRVEDSFTKRIEEESKKGRIYRDEFKLRILEWEKDKNFSHSHITGKREELIKYDEELEKIGIKRKTYGTFHDSYIFSNKNIYKIVNFLATGEFLKENNSGCHNFKLYDYKKTLEDIKKFCKFFNMMNNREEIYKKLFICLPVVVQQYFLYFASIVVVGKMKSKESFFCNCIKLLKMFFGDEKMKNRIIFKRYINDKDLKKYYENNLNVCKKYFEKKERLNTLFFGAELKPKDKSSFYDFSNSGLFDRNLLPLISQYI